MLLYQFSIILNYIVDLLTDMVLLTLFSNAYVWRILHQIDNMAVVHWSNLQCHSYWIALLTVTDRLVMLYQHYYWYKNYTWSMYVVMSLSVYKSQISLFEYRRLYKQSDRVFSDNSTPLGYYTASSGYYHYLLHNSPEEHSSQPLHSRILNIILILPQEQCLWWLAVSFTSLPLTFWFSFLLCISQQTYLIQAVLHSLITK
jgi:hypothetical protein